MQSLCLSLSFGIIDSVIKELVVLLMQLVSQLSIESCCCFAISDKAMYIVLH